MCGLSVQDLAAGRFVAALDLVWVRVVLPVIRVRVFAVVVRVAVVRVAVRLPE